MPESAREKISMFSHVDKNQVICLPDVNTIYKVPVILYEHKLAEWFAERLSLKEVSNKLLEASLSIIPDIDTIKQTNNIMNKWYQLVDR
jgi:CTP synthase